MSKKLLIQNLMATGGRNANGDGWTVHPKGWDTVDVSDTAVTLDENITDEPCDALRDQTFDAILVMAGDVGSDGRPTESAREPLRVAVRQFKHQQRLNGGEPNTYVLSLGGGSYHHPNYTNAAGFCVHASTSSSDYLLKQGIDQGRLLKEWSSYDTIANAFFARINHTDIRGWRKLLVITSERKQARMEALYSWIFGLSKGTSAPYPAYDITVYGVPDQANDTGAYDALYRREAASLEALNQTRDGIYTMSSFHEWFYTQHKAYAVTTRKGSQRTSEFTTHGVTGVSPSQAHTKRFSDFS